MLFKGPAEGRRPCGSTLIREDSVQGYDGTPENRAKVTALIRNQADARRAP